MIVIHLPISKRIPKITLKVTISGNLSSREIVFVTLDIFHSILMLTFEFLHFETLLKIKLKFDVNQLLFSASQDFDVWNRSARAAPAGGPALLSCGVLLLSRDLCTGCCTINGLMHCMSELSEYIKKIRFLIHYRFSHWSKSSFFVQKFNFDLPRKL